MKLAYQYLSIFFGDMQMRVFPLLHTTEWQQASSLVATPAFNHLQHELAGIKHLIFAHQLHGTQGLHITETNLAQLRSFTVEADFLYTHMPSVGLGVLTADCTPVIIYDTTSPAFAVIHAGRRGTVHNIVHHAFAALQQTYDTQASSCQIYIGPAARSCCYILDSATAHLCMQTEAGRQATQQINNNTYTFDMLACITHQLRELGISPESIHTTYCICTICNLSFCSHRRQQEAAGRQMSVAMLHK